MTARDDDRIAKAFDALRAADLGRTPGFRRMLAPRRPPAGRRPLLLAAALAVVLMLGWAGARILVPAPAPAPEFTLGSLRMPTDFLLDLPGSTLVTTVPVLGRSDDWFPETLGTKGPS